MGDQPRSATLDFYNIFGIKSLVTKWNPDKKTQKQAKLRQTDQSLKASNEKNVEDQNEPTVPPSSMFDDGFFIRPPILLKSLTKKNQTSSNTNDLSTRRTTSHRSPTYSSSSNFGSRRSTSPPDSLRSKSTGRGIKSHTSPPSPTDSSSHGRRRSKTPSSRSKSTGRRSKSQTLPVSPTYLSSSSSHGSKTSTSPSSSVRGSHRSNDGMGKRSASETEIPAVVTPTPKTSTPILYSQSTTWRTPQAIEMKLDCTLEELCHGCVKKIAISRDVISNGMMKKEEEVLTINVKPGWKKGTRIRFEGKGSEKPGYVAADIVFLIDEIQHPLFTREGDDLEYGIEIPLMEALIGCSISVPLLGEETMWLTFSDIIYPGFQKVLPGQGMPTKVQGNRGALRLKFFIQFPTQLTDQQRGEASTILQDCCF
ncbi:HSP40/DnaJ peptide-binding protein [Euphorbia peplus]|nr:HSP40/DnaJ peptide-binding protein [Euphorbia peplus]